MSAPSSLITITTDFGLEDGYVAAMKGTVLSIAPDARLIDVTHQVHPQDIMEAAFVLQSVQPYFPDGTIHLVVVDPGVGTSRRAVALRQGRHWFVGPDNGIFPLALQDGSPDEVVELDEPDVWRSPTPSNTFHGRDIFAPAAGHLAAGRALSDLGSSVDQLEQLQWGTPIVDPPSVVGRVAHVDHFGNCITNVDRPTLAEAADLRETSPSSDAFPALKAFAGSTILTTLHSTYGAVPEGEPLLLFGSTGLLEIGVNGGNAAELLDIRKGDSVKVEFDDS